MNGIRIPFDSLLLFPHSGGLFHSTETLEELVFQYATQTINNDSMILHKRLMAIPEHVKSHDSLSVSDTGGYCERRDPPRHAAPVWQGLTLWSLAVCRLLGQGVAGIFGPQAGSTSALVQSMCDTMDIPHVETSWEMKQRRQDFLVNLHPHPSTLARVSQILRLILSLIHY